MSGIGEGVQLGDHCAASMVMNMGVQDHLRVAGRYRAEGWRPTIAFMPMAMKLGEEIRWCDEVLAGPALRRVAYSALNFLLGRNTIAKERERLLRQFSSLPRELAWVEEFDNVVTDAGKKLALDTILAGSAFTATTRMGLKGTGSAAAADTQASHAGWSEVGGANSPTYTGNRQTPSFSAASGSGTVSKATSAAVSFAITNTGTVAGAFININGSATKDDTTGTLFSAGDFSVSRSVINGDTVNVSYTLSS